MFCIFVLQNSGMEVEETQSEINRLHMLLAEEEQKQKRYKVRFFKFPLFDSKIFFSFVQLFNVFFYSNYKKIIGD